MVIPLEGTDAMKCNNKMCIYQNNNICTFGEIEIDWRGNCKNWINTRITRDTLDFSKFYTNLLIKDAKNHDYNPETGDLTHKSI